MCTTGKIHFLLLPVTLSTVATPLEEVGRLQMVFAAAPLVQAVAAAALAMSNPSSSSSKSTALTSTHQSLPNQRSFHFVPNGELFDPSTYFPNRPWIACDGRIEAVKAATADFAIDSLELSHWNGNDTPKAYYADTSTEIALALPHDIFTNAVIVNNHVDVDGILSVFACLQPHLAQQHRNLLISAAEAGDFGEWTSDSGVVLNGCLAYYFDSTDKAGSYRRALDALPLLLQIIDGPDGGEAADVAAAVTSASNTELNEVLKLGQAALEAARRDHVYLCGNTARPGPGRIVLVPEPSGRRELSPLAVHKHLVDAGLWGGGNTTPVCHRILRYSVHENDKGNDGHKAGNKNMYSYRYETPGYAWVHKLRDRRPIPNVENVDDLVHALNNKYDNDEDKQHSWTKGGPSDLTSLVGICQSNEFINDSPDTVAALLVDLDIGAR